MHAMSSSSLNPAASCAKLNEFVARYIGLFVSNMGTAAKFRGRGENALADMYQNDAFFSLGFGLHPVMDSTSPVHRDFTSWRNRDFHRHGDFWNSKEDLSYLLANPELVGETINKMHGAMKGKTLDCGCGR
jgi:hypothetical protein